MRGNWVDSAQDRGYWRALVNVALKFRVPKAMELYDNRDNLTVLIRHIPYSLFFTIATTGEIMKNENATPYSYIENLSTLIIASHQPLWQFI